MFPAQYYEPRPGGDVQCRLCPWHCLIHEGNRGICRVRENQQGQLLSRNYAQLTACNLDPIEKKPLYHFYPGCTILSLGSFGCNFHCKFCQNWTLAHTDPPTFELTPEQAVAAAKREAAGGNNIGIAYTYNEPVVWFEYVMATARLARAAGLKNVLVTNGFIEEEPLSELLPYIDAMNIDLKGFTRDYYQQICKGRLEPVQKTVATAARRCHLELTTLLVTDLNDSSEEITALTDWVSSLSPDIPLHLSRYFPNYELDAPPTPLSTMIRAYGIARERLHYVYLGNVSGLGGSDTNCPGCGTRLISRRGYTAEVLGLHQQACDTCGRSIPVVMAEKGCTPE